MRSEFSPRYVGAVRSVLTLVVLVLLIAPCAFSANGLSARDYLIANVGEVQASPDGKTALYTVATPNLSTNRNDVRVFTLLLESGAAATIDGLPDGVSNVRWSPKGDSIAFFGSREGKRAVWSYELASKKLLRICDYDLTNRFLSKSGNMLSWSPDGSLIAFAGTLEPASKQQDPLVITRAQYKTRTSFSDNRAVHVYVVPSEGGAPKLLTAGKFDEHSIDWSADGKEIVFLSNRSNNPDVRLNYDIFAVDVASGKQRQITQTPGVEMDPHVSQDGKWIAYVATKRNLTTIDSVAEDAHVWIVPYAGGEARELTGAMDRRNGNPQFSEDSKTVLFTASDRGRGGLYSVPAAGGTPAPVLVEDAQVRMVDPVPGSKTFLAVRTDSVTPPELGLIGIDGHWKRLTSLSNDSVVTKKSAGAEEFTFKSFDGTSVEGWLYQPRRAGKIPLILSVHGGPHGAFGYSYDTRAQYFVSRGYAVLTINPRGSSGYGQRFSDGTLNEWGGGDYKDLMAGLDEALRKHANLDAQNLFVVGGSYGGFMTNWIVTQTHRFRAAVAEAAPSNLVSFYATSLYQDLMEAEFSGFPWEKSNFAALWKWSPLAHVANVTTPTLLIHGEQDNDVHITQAEEMYTALQRRGIESVLVRYPREGHGNREPAHRVDEMERVVTWFDQHRKQSTE